MIVGAKQLFSWEMLRLIIITCVLSLLQNKLEEKLCEWFSSYCFFVEHFAILIYIVLLYYFVLTPFAKLFGLKTKK